MDARYHPPFEAYVAPARARPQIWRLILGLLFAGAVYILWSVGILVGVWFLTDGGDPRLYMQRIAAAESPREMFVLFSTFLGMALGPMLAVKLIHRRTAGSLFGRAPRVLRDFVLAAALVGAVYAVALGLWFARYDPVQGLDPGIWLAALPLAILALLVQTGAEELLFRGYILQQLAARFRSRIVWMLVPTVLFGAAHFDPGTAGGNVWLVVLATAGFGLVAADLTAATGSIGAAWGFHFANNTVAILFLATEGTLPGLALFLTPYAADDPSLRLLILGDLAILVAAWLLVRRVLRR